MNELEIRDLLADKLDPDELVAKIVTKLESKRSWEEKRPLWYFLFNTLREHTLNENLQSALKRKERIPFDILIELCARANLQPTRTTMQAVLKGVKKQKAGDEILSAKGFDKWDQRLTLMRAEVLEQKIEAQKGFRGNMIEKFEFLKNQRMIEQAGRVLKRMIQLYPGDQELDALKRDFDEQWAREVLANHAANLNVNSFDRTLTQPSGKDQEMLQSFLREGEAVTIEHREFALDLAIALWFLEDYERGLQILAWAPINASSDWIRAEMLYAARRFVEVLEHLDHLEIKYIEQPETTFAVSYLRAQALFALGQKSTALEIIESIVRVRPGYRSAHALILEWTEGVSWE